MLILSDPITSTRVAGGGDEEPRSGPCNTPLTGNAGNQDFSIEGHIECIGERNNELDDTIEVHVLAQPQFRWDAGKAWFETLQQLLAGIENQYWQNKLGDKETDESAAQLLAVWRF